MDVAQGPTFSSEPSDEGVRLKLAGHWTLDACADIEEGAQALVDAGAGVKHAILDLAGVQRMDTAGAWLIDGARQQLDAKGVSADFAGGRPEIDILLKEAHFRSFEQPPGRKGLYIVTLLADVGESVVASGRDVYRGVEFLGEVVASIGKSVIQPAHFRGTALVAQIETIALRGVPIIVLINFLVGAIVAQQGIFQLRRFGATILVVDLIGILILRELGVLLTAIMISGRSGSAITAELGSMKMREEIDALIVMGLRPIDVLIAPRILALILSLPLLTFLADMAALAGGMLVSWLYGGITPKSFVALLPEAIALRTFLSGLIKAPFMGLIIGLIACMEGLAVAGSAESLGRQVTASVVKSIFMVIVVDGLFAVFFATIRF
ncbi:MlaE family lipid ABC transporter permease subunit [Methylocella silvestris]|uniref:ABC transporter permease n=1 Tax=Methylocella silvestris TaxID=199596 RepID=A0A2J7THV9_METSI|nr:MlaE family lipid ABC transporter permease subunit [Methylocella silvestris]PNG26361.1 ABC transporter permease [Methylocella silvestris]